MHGFLWSSLRLGKSSFEHRKKLLFLSIKSLRNTPPTYTFERHSTRKKTQVAECHATPTASPSLRLLFLSRDTLSRPSKLQKSNGEERIEASYTRAHTHTHTHIPHLQPTHGSPWIPRVNDFVSTITNRYDSRNLFFFPFPLSIPEIGRSECSRAWNFYIPISFIPRVVTSEKSRICVKRGKEVVRKRGASSGPFFEASIKPDDVSNEIEERVRERLRRKQV